MNSFQFSQDQRNAVNGICNQLLDPNTKSHVLTVLTGSAGTGKTTVVGEIINKINQQSPLTSVALCATTHRAATVLQDITGKPVITGHALFNYGLLLTNTARKLLQMQEYVTFRTGL